MNRVEWLSSLDATRLAWCKRTLNLHPGESPRSVFFLVNQHPWAYFWESQLSANLLLSYPLNLVASEAPVSFVCLVSHHLQSSWRGTLRILSRSPAFYFILVSNQPQSATW